MTAMHACGGSARRASATGGMANLTRCAVTTSQEVNNVPKGTITTPQSCVPCRWYKLPLDEKPCENCRDHDEFEYPEKNGVSDMYDESMETSMKPFTPTINKINIHTGRSNPFLTAGHKSTQFADILIHLSVICTDDVVSPYDYTEITRILGEAYHMSLIHETKSKENSMNGLAEKSLDVTSIKDAQDKVSDIQVVGNGDTFQLLCKASSKSQGWMKSAKACEILGVGCVVQVTTQHGSNVAEAVCFVPGVQVEADVNGGRKLVKSLK
jgi:hypothetical protein